MHGPEPMVLDSRRSRRATWSPDAGVAFVSASPAGKVVVRDADGHLLWGTAAAWAAPAARRPERGLPHDGEAALLLGVSAPPPATRTSSSIAFSISSAETVEARRCFSASASSLRKMSISRRARLRSRGCGSAPRSCPCGTSRRRPSRRHADVRVLCFAGPVHRAPDDRHVEAALHVRVFLGDARRPCLPRRPRGARTSGTRSRSCPCLRSPRNFRISKPTPTSCVGSPVSETRMVSPMPSTSSAPIAIALLIEPGPRMPASGEAQVQRRVGRLRENAVRPRSSCARASTSR